MRQLFESWGRDAKLEEYSVLFPTPRERLLEMTAPTKFVDPLAGMVAELEEARALGELAKEGWRRPPRRRTRSLRARLPESDSGYR